MRFRSVKGLVNFRMFISIKDAPHLIIWNSLSFLTPLFLDSEINHISWM